MEFWVTFMGPTFVLLLKQNTFKRRFCILNPSVKTHSQPLTSERHTLPLLTSMAGHVTLFSGFCSLKPGNCYTHTHTSALTWFLTYWAETSGIYTLQIKHTIEIKHTPSSRREGERCGAGGREDSKRLTQSGRRAFKAHRKWGHGGSEEHRDDEKSCSIYPRRSLKSMQPKENQSALLSYAVPFWRTSGAI